MSRRISANVRVCNGSRPGTVRIQVDIPEDLADMLDQLNGINGVPKKVSLAKALRDLREEIHEKGIAVLFEDDEEPSQP